MKGALLKAGILSLGFTATLCKPKAAPPVVVAVPVPVVIMTNDFDPSAKKFVLCPSGLSAQGKIFFGDDKVSTVFCGAAQGITRTEYKTELMQTFTIGCAPGEDAYVGIYARQGKEMIAGGCRSAMPKGEVTDRLGERPLSYPPL